VRRLLAIAARELGSTLTTPVAYVLFAAYLVIIGYVFFVSLGTFLALLAQIQQAQAFHLLEYYNLNDVVIAPALSFGSILLVFMVPLLSMRAFAEERANGTIELLLTSPLSTWEIVLGKYLGILGLLGILIALAALYPALLFAYGDPELLQTLGAMLGLFLYAAALAAVCCFFSSLTRSQIVAAVLGIIACLLLFITDAMASILDPGPAREVIRYLGIQSHLQSLMEGAVHSVDLVYFGLVTVLFISMTRTSVESLRWR